MDNKIKTETESVYGFKIISCKPMPRGFVAETFRLDTDKGAFFIKIIGNPRLADNLPFSLKIQSRIAEKTDFVPSPVKTAEGKFLWVSADNKTVSLYDYIDGVPNTADANGNPHGAEGDFTKIVPMAAQVYGLNLPCEKKEGFRFLLQPEMEAYFNGEMTLTAGTSDFMAEWQAFINNAWITYSDICSRISGGGNFYLTHGDMPGNLVRDKNNKLYIIDWDDILEAPIERDFWLYMDSEDNIGKIAEILNENGVKWKFNQNYYRYYVYTRFFEDLYGYLEADMIAKTPEINYARTLKTEVFDWLVPMMG